MPNDTYVNPPTEQPPPAPGANTAVLAVSGNIPKPFEIGITHTASIGRAKENVVILPDNARVSRFHALIRCDNGFSYQVVDLGSRNGTVLDGDLVVTPRRFESGAQIDVGGVKIDLHTSGPDMHSVVPGAGQRGVVCLLVATLDTFAAAADALQDAQRAQWLGKFFRNACHLLLAGGGWLDKFRDSSVMAYWEEGESRPTCAERAMATGLKILANTPEIAPPAGCLSRAGVTLHMGPVKWPPHSNELGSAVDGKTVEVAFNLDQRRAEDGVPFLLTEPCLAGLPDEFLLKMSDIGPVRLGDGATTIRSFGLKK